MIRRRSARPLIAGAMVAIALVGGSVLAGCGSGSTEATAPDDCTRVAPGADGTTEVTVVGRNLAFDVSCLEVEPGTLVVTFDNRDRGVTHDFHLTGHGLDAATELEAGPTTRTLTVELTEPGSYTFACDPHATMEGRLLVAGATPSS